MWKSPIPRFVTLAALATHFGCSPGTDQAPPRNHSPAPHASKESQTAPGGLKTTPGDIRITAAAKEKLDNLADGQRYFVRLRREPGGCTGVMTKLDLQLDDATSADEVQTCDGVRCIYLKDHAAYVQGAVIDFKNAGKEVGFLVEFPNMTAENKTRTMKWAMDELETRARQRDEQDRATGKLAARIADFRKLAKDDRDNVLSHYELARLLAFDGQYADAIKSYERTLEIDPKFATAYRELAKCLIKSNQNSQAIDVLTKGCNVAIQPPDVACRTEMRSLLDSLKAPAPANKK